MQFSIVQLVPRFQHQPLGSVFTVFSQFFVFQHTESFAGVIVAHHVRGVEDVAEFVASQAVEFGVGGVEFGAEYSIARRSGLKA